MSQAWCRKWNSNIVMGLEGARLEKNSEKSCIYHLDSPSRFKRMHGKLIFMQPSFWNFIMMTLLFVVYTEILFGKTHIWTLVKLSMRRRRRKLGTWTRKTWAKKLKNTRILLLETSVKIFLFVPWKITNVLYVLTKNAVLTNLLLSFHK